MLITCLAAAALNVATACAPSTVSPRVDHGKLAWFEGSFEDLLAKAKTDKKIVFIDFWADW